MNKAGRYKLKLAQKWDACMPLKCATHLRPELAAVLEAQRLNGSDEADFKLCGVPLAYQWFKNLRCTRFVSIDAVVRPDETQESVSFQTAWHEAPLSPCRLDVLAEMCAITADGVARETDRLVVRHLHAGLEVVQVSRRHVLEVGVAVLQRRGPSPTWVLGSLGDLLAMGWTGNVEPHGWAVGWIGKLRAYAVDCLPPSRLLFGSTCGINRHGFVYRPHGLATPVKLASGSYALLHRYTCQMTWPKRYFLTEMV